ncbi:MAG: cytochrome c oxidase subunit 3 [Chloroflexi bacterium]|nr:cytochrome c oxidase subunit 3 [Chloroflexota bacterium]
MALSTSALAPHAATDAHAHARRGISNPILGMILFIASEVMFFAGLFAAYFNVRFTAAHWPPLVNEAPFEPFQIRNEMVLAAILTAVLVLSSVTMQMAVWAIRRGDRTAFLRNTGVTLVLGLAFLTGQVYDYLHLGFGITDTAFGSTFYTLTGFHGAHVLGGTIMLSVVLYRGLAGQFSARHHDAVEATSLYWHFVDVVWIVLFSSLYLL